MVRRQVKRGRKLNAVGTLVLYDFLLDATNLRRWVTEGRDLLSVLRGLIRNRTAAEDQIRRRSRRLMGRQPDPILRRIAGQKFDDRLQRLLTALPNAVGERKEGMRFSGVRNKNGRDSTDKSTGGE